MHILMIKSMYSGSFCWRDGSFRQSFWLQILVGPDNKWIPFIKGDWTADTLKYMKPYIAEADLYMREVLYTCDAKFKRCRGGWDEMFKKMVKSGRGRVVVADGAWDEKSVSVADVQIPVPGIAAGASGYQGALGNTDCVALSSATGCKLLNIDPALFLAMSAKKKQLRLSEVGEVIDKASAGKYAAYKLKLFYPAYKTDRHRKELMAFAISSLSWGKMLVKIQKACGYDQHVMLIDCDTRLVYDGDPTFGEFAHPLTIDTMKMMGIVGFRDARMLYLRSKPPINFRPQSDSF